jgi:hypothetical protein
MKPESEALIASAAFKGNLRLPSSWWSEAKIFTEIDHYFNADRDETGYVAFPWTVHECVIRFDPPRKWACDVLDQLHWEPLSNELN